MLEDLFGNSVIVKVLDFFLENRHWDYTKKDVARHLEVSRTQLYRIWNILESLDLVKETRKIGPATLYMTNMDSRVVKSLEKLSLEVARHINEKALIKEPIKEVA